VTGGAPVEDPVIDFPPGDQAQIVDARRDQRCQCAPARFRRRHERRVAANRRRQADRAAPVAKTNR